jgi:ribulose kinase
MDKNVIIKKNKWRLHMKRYIIGLDEGTTSARTLIYDIKEDKLSAVLNAINRAPNQKLYKYLKNCLAELKTAYEG